LTHSGRLTHKVVTRQPWIRRRSGKVRRLQTDILTTEPRRLLSGWCVCVKKLSVMSTLFLSVPPRCQFLSLLCPTKTFELQIPGNPSAESYSSHLCCRQVNELQLQLWSLRNIGIWFWMQILHLPLNVRILLILMHAKKLIVDFNGFTSHFFVFRCWLFLQKFAVFFCAVLSHFQLSLFHCNFVAEVCGVFLRSFVTFPVVFVSL